VPAPTIQSHPVWRACAPDPDHVRRIAHDLDMAPLLAAILAQRGATDGPSAEAFLTPSLEGLLDPFGLTDLERAAERVTKALLDKETILIYGDADVDGLSATALLCQFLSTVGAMPKVYVPNRAFDGYSINDAGIAAIEAAGATLVITVDNGTSAIEPVATLQSRGIDVIITDHHLPGEQLPPAFAVVNPCREDCTYGFQPLAGVGVAFKLACGVAAKLRDLGRNGERMAKVLGEVMAWVSMGTVSDIMPLWGENRILVSRGLRALPRTTSPGLRALCAVSRIGPGADCRAEDIAFRLAPRLNAASRMGRSDLSVSLVTGTDENICNKLAGELDDLNKQRQGAERDLLLKVDEVLAGHDFNEAIVISGEDWNSGLLGLVAGRLSRRYGVPAVLASWGNGDPGKGSCRSVAGFDVHGALAAGQEHLAQFGGHAMAAGFSVSRASFADFAEGFRRRWRDHVATGTPRAPLEFEGELPLIAINLALVKQIDRLEPFGEANRRPVFATPRVQLGEVRRMGGDGTHVAMQVFQGPTTMRVVAFSRGDLADALVPGQTLDLMHRPKINNFRGISRVELELVDLRLSAASAVQGEAS
jgi:single-stranded-DNA-specific exonuclease